MSKSDSKVPLDHLRSKKKPVTRSVRIATDQEVAERFQEAKQRYDLARMRVQTRPGEETDDELTVATREYERLEKDLEDASINFVFQSMGRRRYDALLKAHPITDDQREELKKQNNGEDAGIEWNYDTFPDALISMSLKTPDISEEEMVEWLQSDDWNTAEVQALFTAALEANSTRAVLDLGKG